MYDPGVVLSTIDSQALPILLLAGAAMVGNYVWFVAAFRAARRDRVYSIPLFCTFYWFAHDLSLLGRYDAWFNGYNHWFMMLWWVAFIPAVLFEIAFLAQNVRLAGSELLPAWSRRAFAALTVLGVVVAVIVWESVKYIFEDDLYLLGFGLTIVSYPIFGFSLLVKRRSADGQTTVMWGAFLVTAVGYFTVSAGWLGSAFQSWQWLGLGAVSIAGGAVMLWQVHRKGALTRNAVVSASVRAG